MKRLVCCLDGTWNDDSDPKAWTNIVKLHRAVLPSDPHGVEQRSRYVVGIATGKVRFSFALGASGLEVGDRIRTAYQFLVDTYEPGDEIYLFGFSRGAFEARSLAGLIALVGIVRRDGNARLEDAWKAYRHRHRSGAEAEIDKVRAAAHYPVRIKCLGVWDTVGNIGNPFYSGGFIGRRVRFHDTSLSDKVDVGLHALAIDEKRGPFEPILWTQSEDAPLPAHQHVEQVWFAGVHADVGGGYDDTSGLSDISLLWMTERVAELTGLAFDAGKLAELTRPDPLAPQHCSMVGKVFRWTALLPFIRLVHQDRLAIGPLRRWLLGGWRTNRLPDNRVSVNEAVHHSVAARWGQQIAERPAKLVERVVAYRPANLTDLLSRRR